MTNLKLTGGRKMSFSSFNFFVSVTKHSRNVPYNDNQVFLLYNDT